MGVEIKEEGEKSLCSSSTLELPKKILSIEIVLKISIATFQYKSCC